MIGATLLMSSEDSPFVEFWNYSTTTLNTPVYQSFNASIQAQEYASGGQAGYQRGFAVVLLAVFLTNIFVLLYMIINRGLVTDFSEPPNLFAVSLNSPPSHVLAGACGAGPVGVQYASKWGVEMEREHLYVTPKEGGPVYGATATRPGGARAESMLSFGELFGRRRKFDRLDSHQQGSGDAGMELGQRDTRSSSAYLGAGVRSQSSGYSGYGGYAGAGAERDHEEEEEERDDVVELRPAEQPTTGVLGNSSLGRVFSKIAKRKSVL